MRGFGVVAQECRGGAALGLGAGGGGHEDAVEGEGCGVGPVGGGELGAACGCALEALEQRGDVGRFDEVEECGQGDAVVEGELGEGGVGGEVVDDEGGLGVGVEVGVGGGLVGRVGIGVGLESCLVHGVHRTGRLVRHKGEVGLGADSAHGGV